MEDTYSKYGVEYIMWCMGLYAEDLAKLKEDDPDKHADVLRVRAMIGKSLRDAMRSQSQEGLRSFLLIPVIFRRAYECVRVARALNSTPSPRETVHKPIDYVTIRTLIQQFR